MAPLLPKWLTRTEMDNNPKWPDVVSKAMRAVLMKQKPRTLWGVLTTEAVLAMFMFQRTGDTDSNFTGFPSMSVFRLLSAVGITVCSFGLFCASVFLEPPPSEEGREAIRATMLGPLMCIKTDIVVIQVVHAIFGLVAELSLASEPVPWLLSYSYAGAPVHVVVAAAGAALFVGCIKDDPEYVRWSGPMRKAGIEQLELLLHLGPLALSLTDLLLVKEGRLLSRYLPDFWPMVTLCVLGANVFYGLCHSHALLSGGCYLHPWMKGLYSFRGGSRFLVKAVTALFVMCKIVRNIIIMRAALY